MLTQYSIVTQGDRIAQLIIEIIVTPEVLEVDVSVETSFLCVGLFLMSRTWMKRIVAWMVSGLRADTMDYEQCSVQAFCYTYILIYLVFLLWLALPSKTLSHSLPKILAAVYINAWTTAWILISQNRFLEVYSAKQKSSRVEGFHSLLVG